MKKVSWLARMCPLNRGSILTSMKIAVDGGAGVGKSTVARLLAQRLGILYVNTGAMYRAIAWALHEGLSLDEIDMDLEGQDVWVNGQNVTDSLYNELMDDLSSQYSSRPDVRQKLIVLQQKLAQNKDVVMEGRDIGTVVLPDADLKLYLTASVEERARRRALQRNEDIETIKQAIEERDKRDREGFQRHMAEDAVVLNTDGLSIDEVVEQALAALNQSDANAGV